MWICRIGSKTRKQNRKTAIASNHTLNSRMKISHFYIYKLNFYSFTKKLYFSRPVSPFTINQFICTDVDGLRRIDFRKQMKIVKRFDCRVERKVHKGQ